VEGEKKTLWVKLRSAAVLRAILLEGPDLEMMAKTVYGIPLCAFCLLINKAVKRKVNLRERTTASSNRQPSLAFQFVRMLSSHQ
jgi:hypothetical protein